MSEKTKPAASPMMVQHARVKAKAPDCVLLYRVGEFYEILRDDAALASRVLNIKMTRRQQKDADDIPMCGVPAGAVEAAVKRLLQAGYRVALSEQAPDPESERPLQVHSPGTSMDDDVLPALRNNNLLCVETDDVEAAFAWVDVSTGEMGATIVPVAASGAVLGKVGPTEVLLSRRALANRTLAAFLEDVQAPKHTVKTPVPQDEAADRIREFYGVADHSALGGHSRLELVACANLLSYVSGVMGVKPSSVGIPRRSVAGDSMEIDHATLVGLNVLGTPSSKEGSLLSVMDRTVTPSGARLLVRQLTAPLVDPAVIRRRLGMVGILADDARLRGECRDALRAMPDVLRATGRLGLGKGSPRDMATIRDGLGAAAALADILSSAPPALASIGRELSLSARGPCADIRRVLSKALAKDLPSSAAEGGFVAEGYDGRLDETRARLSNVQGDIDGMQARYVRETGIKTLKIRNNTVIGYHVEVPKGVAANLKPPVFTHKQDLKDVSKFSTGELDALAGDLERAAASAVLREREIYDALSFDIAACREPLRRIAHAAAALDLVAGLAQASAEGMWVEPEVTDGDEFDVAGGRHPVAEQLLMASGQTFVPNDCRMDAHGRLWLLTGPNMSGKSTFMRQNAVIALMAQVGCRVPAEHARIGVVDRLFSRVGASDDLARGRSTFMVEMIETATILNRATHRSMVILDEVGRGTSTHDGLSIAQATMEYLRDSVGCRAIFATHYHELAEVAEQMPGAVCMSMEAAGDDESFAYRVVPGKAGRSYGIKVARMAGMPPSVVRRAAEILAEHLGEQVDVGFESGGFEP